MNLQAKMNIKLRSSIADHRDEQSCSDCSSPAKSQNESSSGEEGNLSEHSGNGKQI